MKNVKKIMQCKYLSGALHKEGEVGLEIAKGEVSGKTMVRMRRTIFDRKGTYARGTMYLTKQEALELSETLKDVASKMRG
ncbi:hypothetical protein [Succinatimonas hippei]|uniref:hypothetical protein n=1 Tax=Succinatimonas hippei TaxID=626938 RepID=UPI00249224DE|nr:hypothetical protein [Succinatimonas hippei]